MDVNNNLDVIDSRDVIARIEELESIPSRARDESEDDELRTLLELAEDGETNVSDWSYGEALVRESFWEDYVRELASDLGLVDDSQGWPLCHIDWAAAADALLVDYSELDFDGVIYYARA